VVPLFLITEGYGDGEDIEMVRETEMETKTKTEMVRKILYLWRRLETETAEGR
jgi:hypothetical protein